MEAVKQGSATVGLKSATHAVLVAQKVSLLYLIENESSFTHLFLLKNMMQDNVYELPELQVIGLLFVIFG